jgi:uncharacterized protein
MDVKKYIQHLQLLPHPEGGYYKETYRSSENIPAEGLPARFEAGRSFSTAIYYLLEKGDYSGFHRIKSDECWHFYGGSTLLIHVIEEDGKYYTIRLGSKVETGEVFQCVVPAGAWFASEPAPETDFSLVGCTVAPGFDFADFEMAKKDQLLSLYSEHKNIIERLCR